jgi:uncharacterized protein (UPF0548 family)
MLLLHAPSASQVRNVLAAQRREALTYAAIGASAGTPPPGYAADHNRVLLGTGQATFERAAAALQRWQHIPRGWMQLLWPDHAPAPDIDVAILVELAGVWALSVCRVVYVLDVDGPVRRAGFAWGTLPAHVARGEERFMVEWNHNDDTVWYDIRAVSRPNSLLLTLGYPAMRLMQRRFARDSKAAMVRAVS